MTKTELEARVRDLEWTLREIIERTERARKHYENLGYGAEKDLPTEKNPYYVIGAMHSCVESITGLAQAAVPVIA
jgi:hypothetical protein